MSGVEGKIAGQKVKWLRVPRGARGQSFVRIGDSGETIEVRWRRDEQGIWIELPDGVSGFDLIRSDSDEGVRAYEVSRRGFSGQWSGLSYLRAGEAQAGAGASASKKGLRVRAQMPGKVVRILVAQGQRVEKDQPLLVMEAMKMENEIRAAYPGEVKKIHVSEGQAVESGADLIGLG